MNKLIIKARNTLAQKKAETYVDTGVKILIAVVIGALLLAGLTVLFKDVILKRTTEEVNDLFDGVGSGSGTTPSTP